jgi:peptidoglycan-associated lipoprotein
MKNANLIGMFFLSMALAAGMTGCKHKSYLTEIPSNGGPPQGGATTTTPPPGPGLGDSAPTPAPISAHDLPPTLDNKEYTPLFNGPHNEDREKFKADTLYFDFDSSAIKPSEESKLQDIANYFKENTRFEGLIIEGNCDERGTEKYNLSLGERRALAAREYLNNLGVKPERLKTVTYGASRPADPGHNEEAWKKNRRDDFILVTPK